MTKNLEFYISEAGTPSARGEDQRLACYLETDIQGSVEVASELIALLRNVEYRGEFNGNSHSVDIRENSVLIGANFDEDAADRLLSRDEMADSLIAWREFLQQTASNSSSG